MTFHLMSDAKYLSGIEESFLFIQLWEKSKWNMTLHCSGDMLVIDTKITVMAILNPKQRMGDFRWSIMSMFTLATQMIQCENTARIIPYQGTGIES